MAITEYLNNIKNAVLGKDVRDSIHDAIAQCYEDATGTPQSIAHAVQEIESYKTQTNAIVNDRLGYPDYRNVEYLVQYDGASAFSDKNLTGNISEDGYIVFWVSATYATSENVRMVGSVNTGTVFQGRGNGHQSALIPVRSGDSVSVRVIINGGTNAAQFGINFYPLREVDTE